MSNKKIAPAAGVAGLIFLFFTPLRWTEKSYAIHHASIFSDGFIDFPRLILYLAVAIAVVFLLNKQDFGFLKTDPFRIFLKRLVARVIDTVLVLGISLAGIAITRYFSPGDVHSVSVPIGVATVWMIYFVVIFHHGKTVGLRLLKLSHFDESGSEVSRLRLLQKEILLILPVILFSVFLGTIIEQKYRDDQADADHLETWALLIWFMIILIYIISPLRIFLSKSRRGLIDTFTRTTVQQKLPEVSGEHSLQ